MSFEKAEVVRFERHLKQDQLHRVFIAVRYKDTDPLVDDMYFEYWLEGKDLLTLSIQPKDKQGDLFKGWIKDKVKDSITKEFKRRQDQKIKQFLSKVDLENEYGVTAELTVKDIM